MQSLARVKLNNWKPDFFLLSNVPISLLVEIGEAHIVCVNFAHFFPIHIDLPANVVLSLHTVLARLVDTLNVILKVFCCDFACQLVTHGTHHDVKDIVPCVIEADCMAIFESDLFVTKGMQIARVYSNFDTVLGPACQSVVLVWSFDVKVRNRWMVACLLHVNVSPILAASLECFTEDRVQGLLKNLLFVEE